MGSDADRFANLDVGQEILPRRVDSVVSTAVSRSKRAKSAVELAGSMVSGFSEKVQKDMEVAFWGVPSGFSDEFEQWQLSRGPWGDRSWSAFRRFLDEKGKVG